MKSQIMALWEMVDIFGQPYIPARVNAPMLHSAFAPNDYLKWYIFSGIMTETHASSANRGFYSMKQYCIFSAASVLSLGNHLLSPPKAHTPPKGVCGTLGGRDTAKRTERCLKMGTKTIKLGNVPKSITSAEARQLWNELRRAGDQFLTNLDRAAVEVCCRAYSEYRGANQQAVDATDPDLKLVWMKVADAARKSLLSTLAEIGFTPAGRAKMKFTPDLPVGDDLEGETLKPAPKRGGKVSNYVT